jgi:hypothetical protein
MKKSLALDENAIAKVGHDTDEEATDEVYNNLQLLFVRTN